MPYQGAHPLLCSASSAVEIYDKHTTDGFARNEQ